MIALQNLVRRLQATGLLLEIQGDIDNKFIDHLANDSRKVGTNGLFVAIRGTAADGHLFIEKTVLNGAIAVVCEAMPGDVHLYDPGIAFLRVSNPRAALAELAAAFYGDPSQQLRLIGATGTNGKTTTVFLLQHMLQHLGWETGLLSTVAYRIGDTEMPATHTTPDVLDTSSMLREMVQAGATACAMEVSSHALDQDRVRALSFDVALFSNLTQDHLDYHGTMEAYLEAKKRLFDQLDADAVAVVNADDPASAAMIIDTRARVVSYGLTGPADVRVIVQENALDGLVLTINGDTEKFRLVGDFNAYNLGGVFAVGRGLGFERKAILEALTGAPPVPGRFEQINGSRQRNIIVDYAHTPDALKNVLATLNRAAPDRTVWCIFGCGGDRDRDKRPRMGKIAEQLADRVIVTSDNPRTEDPEEILAEIKTGFERPADASWIVNRREAIQFAAQHAEEGDVVLIAGKGHEPYQELGRGRIHFDDREEARKWFSDF